MAYVSMRIPRKVALAGAKVAGYHADRGTFTRLVIEGRAGRVAMLEAFRDGERCKIQGMRCLHCEAASA